MNISCCKARKKFRSGRKTQKICHWLKLSIDKQPAGYVIRYMILLVSLLFFLTVLVFFTLYHRTYDTPLPSPAKSQELLIQEFAERFQLSVRETDVFKQILKGCSNGEIAGNLYISENTVKFHIKNLLRKTNCANRTELLALFSHSNVL